jgi:hypothetical protein
MSDSRQHHGGDEAHHGAMDCDRIARRVDNLDWSELTAQLDETGSVVTGSVLSKRECHDTRALYDDDRLFRSTIDMARHRFGSGEYRYFASPLPALVAELRAAFWPHLLPVAREWAARLRREAPWPEALDDWLDQCHTGGQTRPTPLLLRYGAGDWNALHRDLYGDLVFPLQVVIGLNQPGSDYSGGELVTVEQRPRAQSRATCRLIGLGEAVVFTTRDRPIKTAKGWAAAPMRHGVSVVLGGSRQTLGLLFHDAA